MNLQLAACLTSSGKPFLSCLAINLRRKDVLRLASTLSSSVHFITRRERSVQCTYPLQSVYSRYLIMANLLRTSLACSSFSLKTTERDFQSKFWKCATWIVICTSYLFLLSTLLSHSLIFLSSQDRMAWKQVCVTPNISGNDSFSFIFVHCLSIQSLSLTDFDFGQTTSALTRLSL
jgi:hypothetical protein